MRKMKADSLPDLVTMAAAWAYGLRRDTDSRPTQALPDGRDAVLQVLPTTFNRPLI